MRHSGSEGLRTLKPPSLQPGAAVEPCGVAGAGSAGAGGLEGLGSPMKWCAPATAAAVAGRAEPDRPWASLSMPAAAAASPSALTRAAASARARACIASTASVPTRHRASVARTFTHGCCRMNAAEASLPA
eukprot:357233-Chlamydomonas_euryale.AAC.13